MDTHLSLLAIILAQASPPLPTLPSSVQAVPKSVQTAPVASVPCNARPWQRLVGRTVGDLLTVKLPAGTRIYRASDPVGAPIAAGRLSVEIGGNTRVRRVYCS